MGRLDNKIALVTGAGHGIGAGIARRFSEEGASVVVVDIDKERAEHVTESLQNSGGKTHTVIADVARSEDTQRMVEEAVACFGGMDIIVNNAALTHFGRSVEADDFEARYDLLMATNVKSVWMTLHCAMPHLRKRGGGSVINIASVHALGGASQNSAYSASKGALVAGAHALAVELAPDLIRINCISPGRITTGVSGGWLRQRLGPEIYQEFQEQFGDWQALGAKLAQPLPVEGLPEDIAHCAVYLASDESRFCTGANIVIDGGMTSLLADPGYRSAAAAEHQALMPEVRAWINEAKRRRENSSV